ncbi:putative cell-cycle-associated protein kinase CDK [Toxoplasma gondii VAND]|uniref:Cyclin-dependent kinase 2 homolog n=1 Tax=Toxoplasma gondii VAND TaxID=933077 RepID=A0A086PRJ6_TOXGO|nr:putative cell-cycle-associated protein kinase CDK [Toxoplasma gondii VAND]
MSLDDFKADLIDQVVPFRTTSVNGPSVERRLRLVERLGGGTYGDVYKAVEEEEEENDRGSARARDRPGISTAEATAEATNGEDASAKEGSEKKTKGNFYAVKYYKDETRTIMEEGISCTTVRELSAVAGCGHHPNVVRMESLFVDPLPRLARAINQQRLTWARNQQSALSSQQFSHLQEQLQKEELKPQQNFVFAAYEFCPGGDLKKLLAMHRQSAGNQESGTGSPPPLSWGLPLRHVKRLAFQLLNGLAFLHSENLCHRDLKPDNLMLTGTDPETAVLKIGDLGLCRELRYNVGDITPTVCTIYYRSLEVLLGRIQPANDRDRAKYANENGLAAHYGLGVDLWSAGCILAEMIRGTPLFKGTQEFEVLIRVTKVLGTPTEEEWTNCCRLQHYPFRNLSESHFFSEHDKRQNLNAVLQGKLDLDGLDLLARMLDYNPHRRITAAEALSHQWFTDVCFQQLDGVGVHNWYLDVLKFRLGEETFEAMERRRPYTLKTTRLSHVICQRNYKGALLQRINRVFREVGCFRDQEKIDYWKAVLAAEEAQMRRRRSRPVPSPPSSSSPVGPATSSSSPRCRMNSPLSSESAVPRSARFLCPAENTRVSGRDLSSSSVCSLASPDENCPPDLPRAQAKKSIPPLGLSAKEGDGEEAAAGPLAAKRAPAQESAASGVRTAERAAPISTSGRVPSQTERRPASSVASGFSSEQLGAKPSMDCAPSFSLPVASRLLSAQQTSGEPRAPSLSSSSRPSSGAVGETCAGERVQGRRSGRQREGEESDFAAFSGQVAQRLLANPLSSFPMLSCRLLFEAPRETSRERKEEFHGLSTAYQGDRESRRVGDEAARGDAEMEVDEEAHSVDTLGQGPRREIKGDEKKDENEFFHPPSVGEKRRHRVSSSPSLVLPFLLGSGRENEVEKGGYTKEGSVQGDRKDEREEQREDEERRQPKRRQLAPSGVFGSSSALDLKDRADALNLQRPCLSRSGEAGAETAEGETEAGASSTSLGKQEPDSLHGNLAELAGHLRCRPTAEELDSSQDAAQLSFGPTVGTGAAEQEECGEYSSKALRARDSQGADSSREEMLTEKRAKGEKVQGILTRMRRSVAPSAACGSTSLSSSSAANSYAAPLRDASCRGGMRRSTRVQALGGVPTAASSLSSTVRRNKAANAECPGHLSDEVRDSKDKTRRASSASGRVEMPRQEAVPSRVGRRVGEKDKKVSAFASEAKKREKSEGTGKKDALSGVSTTAGRGRRRGGCARAAARTTGVA